MQDAIADERNLLVGARIIAWKKKIMANGTAINPPDIGLEMVENGNNGCLD